MNERRGISSFKVLLKRRRIAARFFWSCTGTSFLALIFFGTICFLAASHSTLENSMRYAQTISEQAAINLNTSLNDMEDLQHEVFINLLLYKEYKVEDANNFARAVGSVLASLWARSSALVDEAYFIDLQGKQYSPNLQWHFTAQKGASYETLEDFYHPIMGRPNWMIDKNGKLLMNRVLISPDDFKAYGYIQLKPKEHYVDVLMNSTAGVDAFCLKDVRGQVWINSVQSSQFVEEVRTLPWSNGSGRIFIADKEYLVVRTEVGNRGLMQYCLFQIDKLLRELWLFAIWIGIGCVGALLGVITLFFIFTRPVDSKMQKLIKSIRNLAKPGSEELSMLSEGDELFELSKHFDTLALQLETLITDIYEAQIAQKEAEYRALQFEYSALQSQINPHFLYNTLESIGSAAKLSGAPDVSESICILAEILRASVRSQESRHTVRDELFYIEKYLSLQQINLGERLSYEIDVDANLYSMLLPKLLLQPLVENSITHGIENSLCGGMVYVSVSHQGNGVNILVADNGVGMDEEVLEKWREGTSLPSTSHTKVGLDSVRKRLEILYKNHFQMHIISEKNRGTVINISVPQEGQGM